jgi:two-component sensor histidine kinase
VEAYRHAFEARLTSLARAQHMVARDPTASVELGGFLREVVEPFGVDRFRLEGPRASIPHQLAPACALLLHELCTNATKYGALSQPLGQVAITWKLDEDRRARLQWRELDGPPVSPPSRAGFGTRLIEMAFPPERGQVRVAYEPDGVRCSVEFLV